MQKSGRKSIAIAKAAAVFMVVGGLALNACAEGDPELLARHGGLIDDFIRGDTRCEQFMGQDGVGADGVSFDYSESLAKVLNAVGPDVAPVMKAIQASCQGKLMRPMDRAKV